MTTRHRTVFGTAVAAMTVAVVTTGLSSCGTGDGDAGIENFVYVLDRQPVTTNAATTLGTATDAAKLSARLYPGAFLPGPGSRLLPNSDFITATVQEDNPDAVDYVIADTANYSDGAPVVCDDFLLSWVAGHQTSTFASDLELMTRVRDVSCAAGSRNFRVDFDPGMGARYREIFGAGEVLPSHTIAERAGVDSVVDAVNSGDEEALSALGEAWSSTFDLTVTDPATVPTYGPFRISERREDGSLLLTPNPVWAGDRPGLDRIEVRGGGDLHPALGHTVDVVDAAVIPGQPTEVELTKAGYTVTRDSGDRADSLTLSTSGLFSTPEARRAFSACIDRRAVTDAVLAATGAQVSPAPLRVARPGTPAADDLAPTADRNNIVDPQLTAASLQDATVRIGYLADQPRYRAIIDALAASCQAGGVTVEGVALDTAALQQPGLLGGPIDALLGTRTTYGRNAAVPVSPMSTLTAIRAAEDLLEEQSTSISLSVEPRLIAVTASASDVSDSGTDLALSWNMDRWVSADHPVSELPDTADTDPTLLPGEVG